MPAEPPSGIRFGRVSPYDVPSLRDLLNRSASADGDEERLSWEDVEHLFLRVPGNDPTVDSLGAWDADRRLVGFGWVFGRQRPVRAGRVHLWGTVDPDARGQGLGRTIIEWSEARGREILRELPPGLPAQAVVDVDERRRDAVRLVEAAGFDALRTYARMERLLDAPVEVPALPTGLRIEPWLPDRSEAVREAHNEVFLEDAHFEPVSVQLWRDYFLGDSSFLPHLSFLALDGDTVAGYALCGARDHDIAAPQGRTAGPDMMGVRPGFQGRGVGSALLGHTLERLRQARFQRSRLEAVASHPEVGLRMYERAGFVATRRTIRYAKDVGG